MIPEIREYRVGSDFIKLVADLLSNASRPVLLVPAALRAATASRLYGLHGLGGTFLASLEQLSHPLNRYMLDETDPDLIIVRSAQLPDHAAWVRRLMRQAEKPSCRIVVLRGVVERA